MSSQTEMEPSSFVLVLRASAGFYFGKDDPLRTMRFLTGTGPTELTFGTGRTYPPGFTNPVRSGIWADVRGKAESLDAAIETWANWARGVAAILSVAANAPVGNLTADLAYETTPGKSERRFWRRTIPDIPLIPRKGRKLMSPPTLALIAAWMKQPVEEQERWHRAFNAYHHALQEWEPGSEIPSLSHLWVGMETLTPLALKQHLTTRGITREDLAREWRIDLSKLNAEVRLRLLFYGDEECYSNAQKARNALLHGYGKLWDVREQVVPIRLQTARYLRTSILELVGLDDSSKEQLLAPAFANPFHWSMYAQMFGTLQGESEELAAEGETYPRVEWAHRLGELPPDDEGDAQFSVEYLVKPTLANGIEFELDAVQVLLPRVDGEQEGGPSTS